MSIVVNGSGTITGISTGGLPDGVVDSDTLANDSVVTGKIADGTIANADVNSSAAIASTKLSGVPSATTYMACLLYTSPSPRDQRGSRMPSSA